MGRRQGHRDRPLARVTRPRRSPGGYEFRRCVASAPTDGKGPPARRPARLPLAASSASVGRGVVVVTIPVTIVVLLDPTPRVASRLQVSMLLTARFRAGSPIFRHNIGVVRPSGRCFGRSSPPCATPPQSEPVHCGSHRLDKAVLLSRERSVPQEAAVREREDLERLGAPAMVCDRLAEDRVSEGSLAAELDLAVRGEVARACPPDEVFPQIRVDLDRRDQFRVRHPEVRMARGGRNTRYHPRSAPTNATGQTRAELVEPPWGRDLASDRGGVANCCVWW